MYGQREEECCPLISATKASKLLYQGCIGYLCYAIDTQTKEEKAENFPVVREFENVFFLKRYQDYPRKLN